MGLYRKKSVTVVAVQFTQAMADAHVLDRGPLPDGVRCERSQYNRNERSVRSATFSVGDAGYRKILHVNDWVITGEKGEHFALGSEAFDSAYDYVGG